MDILELIEQDHRKVESLFKTIESTKDSKKILKAFNEIYTELNLHARAEELVFYPAMREFKETEGFIEEAEEEHEEAEVLLEQIKDFKPSDADFKDKIKELKEAVQHHVQEEENEIFAAVRKAFDSQQLQSLGQEFQEAKGKVAEDVEEALAS